MNLRFSCGGNIVNVGNTHHNDKAITTDFKATSLSCPMRVDRSNWLDGHQYGDWFEIRVGDCVE